jgi:NAD(P)H-dependent FMN reductase
MRRVEWPLRENKRVRGKHVIGIACAGGGGGGSVNAIRNLENYMSYLSMNNVAYIPLSRQNYAMQMKACKEAGKHLIDVMTQPG